MCRGPYPDRHPRRPGGRRRSISRGRTPLPPLRYRAAGAHPLRPVRGEVPPLATAGEGLDDPQEPGACSCCAPHAVRPNASTPPAGWQAESREKRPVPLREREEVQKLLHEEAERILKMATAQPGKKQEASRPA